MEATTWEAKNYIDLSMTEPESDKDAEGNWKKKRKKDSYRKKKPGHLPCSLPCIHPLFLRKKKTLVYHFV